MVCFQIFRAMLSSSWRRPRRPTQKNDCARAPLPQRCCSPRHTPPQAIASGISQKCTTMQRIRQMKPPTTVFSGRRPQTGNHRPTQRIREQTNMEERTLTPIKNEERKDQVRQDPAGVQPQLTPRCRNPSGSDCLVVSNGRYPLVCQIQVILVATSDMPPWRDAAWQRDSAGGSASNPPQA